MSNSKKEIKKYQKILNKVNELRDWAKGLNDEDFKTETERLREMVLDGKENDVIPEAFALVREASRRTLNKEHYDVQILAGLALENGCIAEAKTGEGKTITIYLPAYVEALKGNGVHIVTVNDYLAKRDATDAKKVFDFLGLSVGCVLAPDNNRDRKVAYAKDITYVTNSQLGFDYLKDNIAQEAYEQVLRGCNYAIIDEVDSVLIDEAKTPLIISGGGQDVGDFLRYVDEQVKQLEEGSVKETTTLERMTGYISTEHGDYIKDEKSSTVYLTDQGVNKIEEAFGIENYGSDENIMLQRAINNSLRANYLLTLDKDYIIRDGKIEIVDTFTGRVLPGRRFTNGLHQLIEAKEGVEIQPESSTIASVTYQNFFNKYTKKAGLTGTGKTSEKEFETVYHMPVIEIPTNKKSIREDKDDLIFRTAEEKWDAVVEEVKNTNAIGQPVLIGTTNVYDSEILSQMFDEAGIKHNVLNAKNEEVEAEIISHAGEFGAVTIATNMAGRGTDIILDEKAREVGGLKVIGTERHDSRRIDNQLKGRSGRQGDPGCSQFFISLEDRLMRVFGEEGKLDSLAMLTTPGQPLKLKALTKMMEKAQETVETNNRKTREELVKFDESNNEHREEIYTQRNEILRMISVEEKMLGMFHEFSDNLIERYITDEIPSEEWDIEGMLDEYFTKVAKVNINLNPKNMKKKDLKEGFRQVDDLIYKYRADKIGDVDVVKLVEKKSLLRAIDINWTEFLNSMEYVQNTVSMSSYSQKDPVTEYRLRGLEIFNGMVDKIREDAISNFLLCEVEIHDEPFADAPISGI